MQGCANPGSRPSRACGLKHRIATADRAGKVSRPSRACGLKHGKNGRVMWVVESRPSRACGLKHCIDSEPDGTTEVAPFTGVWIETRDRLCVEAGKTSRPSRACGLKRPD